MAASMHLMFNRLFVCFVSFLLLTRIPRKPGTNLISREKTIHPNGDFL